MNKKSVHKEKEESTTLFLEAFDEIIQPNIANLIPSASFKTKAVVGEQASIYQVGHSRNYTVSKVAARKAVMASLIKKTQDKESTVRFSYSAIDAIESARKGIKFNDFKSIYDLMNLSNSKWAEIIGISERTMQNIVKEKKDFGKKPLKKLKHLIYIKNI